MATEPIKIAGKNFCFAEITTMDQDAYVIVRMRSAGLYELSVKFDPSKDDIGKLGEEIILRALESGALYEILAGILVETGVPWSRATAKANAELFGSITDPQDKKVVYENLATVVLDFLLVADVWSNGSLKSSIAGELVTTPDVNPKQRSLFEEVRNTILENGTLSSEMFPATT